MATPKQQPTLTRLDHLIDSMLARHQDAMEKAEKNLLRAYPAAEAAATLPRAELARLIRGAFAAGLVDAYRKSPRPLNGPPSAFSQN